MPAIGVTTIRGGAADWFNCRKSARETLINDASAAAGAITKEYLKALTTDLDAALLPLTKHQNVLVRLNVAIVAARVASMNCAPS